LVIRSGTPVTLDRFLEWKEKKRIQKESLVVEQQKELQKRGGGKNAALSGRALFQISPTLFVDDADAQDVQYGTRVDEESSEEEQVIREEQEQEEEEEEEGS